MNQLTGNMHRFPLPALALAAVIVVVAPAKAQYAVLAQPNNFTAPQTVTVNGAYTVVGDPGCGAGAHGRYSGIGINGLFGCVNYSLIGDGYDTFVNAPNGHLYFTVGNAYPMVNLDNTGLVTISGRATIGTTAAQSTPGLQVYGYSEAVDGSATGYGGTGGRFVGGSGNGTTTGGYGVVATGGYYLTGTYGGVGILAQGGQNRDGTLARAGNFVGDVNVTGCVAASGRVIGGSCQSDVRLKRNVRPFEPVLSKISQLQPVSFEWRSDEFPQRQFDSGRSIGLIAQDVEKAFPEMVTTDEAGFKKVNYGDLPYLMLQAIRELKADNDSLRQRIRTLEEASGK